MRVGLVRAVAGPSGRRAWAPLRWPDHGARPSGASESISRAASTSQAWSSNGLPATASPPAASEEDYELQRQLRSSLEPLRALARRHRLLEASEEALERAGLTRPVLEGIVRARGPGPAALAEVRLAALRALGAEHRAEVLAGISSQAVAEAEEAGREAGAEQGALPAAHADAYGAAHADAYGGTRHAALPTQSPSSSFARPSLAEALTREGLPAYAAEPGQHRSVCPQCGGGSTGEQSLAVKSDGYSAVWVCHRASCGWAGRASASGRAGDGASAPDDALARPSSRRRKEVPLVRPDPAFRPLSPRMWEFFERRAIPREVVEANGVACELAVVPGKGGAAEEVLAFPYTRGGRLLNVKYRTLDKRFWQVRGAEKVLFGLDQLDLRAWPDLVIVEGEMDKLALEAAGVRNVLSVPDGAPARVREDLPPAERDAKFSYLWRCKEQLDAAARVLVATDNDGPGEALAEELARRLGRERCWRVRWPLTRLDHELAAEPAGLRIGGAAEEATRGSEDDGGAVGQGAAGDSSAQAPDAGSGASSSSPSPAKEAQPPENAWYRKDANEVLIKDGPDMLRALVEAAQPLPIRGLLRFHEYYDEIMRHYHLDPSMSQAVSTGWPSLDPYYKVVPGELTIVTGVPNSGKSEWIDALLCNLAYSQGWTFAMCSMEKKAMDHARQLVEKYTGRPFFDLPYAGRAQRMSLDQLNAGLDWVDDRFHLIRYEDDTLPSVDWVLEVARAAVYRYGIRGLVIDPYNELDHQRAGNVSETEYVSHMLTKIKRFAQVAGVHVWFVAHPRQLQQWRGDAPGLYDISGSAHFVNKADNGLVVHRNRDPAAENPAEVQILVRKVRNKIAGTLGDATLVYDRVNGRYIDPGEAAGSPPLTSARVDHSRVEG